MRWEVGRRYSRGSQDPTRASALKGRLNQKTPPISRDEPEISDVLESLEAPRGSTKYKIIGIDMDLLRGDIWPLSGRRLVTRRWRVYQEMLEL